MIDNKTIRPDGTARNDANRVRHHVPGAAALLLMTLASCSLNPGPTGTTTVVFDEQSHTFSGPISCTAQSNGKLLILATDSSHHTVRVLLSRGRNLVVEKVGIRIPGASGYTEDPEQMWATKIDNTYQIKGWMPPNTSEIARHPFEIETKCRYEVPLQSPPLPNDEPYGAP